MSEAQFFAGRFAAKEAVRKAKSQMIASRPSISFKSIEIFNYKGGKPGVKAPNCKMLIFLFHMMGTMQLLSAFQPMDYFEINGKNNFMEKLKLAELKMQFSL
jgi:hypothetical protein